MAFPDPGLYPGRPLSRRGILPGAVHLRAIFGVCIVLVGLAGCASVPASRPSARPPIARPAPEPAPPLPRSLQPAKPLQCVPYARLRSGIAIYGDARTWWDQAAGRYERASSPQVGAVLVLGGTPGGHVAVVTAILSKRDVLVDHANWANDGAIHFNAPVRDVSENGDWSAVRVWHLASGQLGARIYPARGFVLPSQKLGAMSAPPFGEWAG